MYYRDMDLATKENSNSSLYESNKLLYIDASGCTLSIKGSVFEGVRKVGRKPKTKLRCEN